MPGPMHFTERQVSHMIADAVAAERERCAQIADAAHHRNLADALKAATEDGRLIFDSAQATAATIAEAIRKPDLSH
jgi:hypothetical protein